VLVVFAALGAALVNGLTSLLQRLGVEDAPRGTQTTSGLVAHAIRRPVWLLGFTGMLGGFALQAIALRSGSLAVVQPLITTELFFIIVILRTWYAVPVQLRDWLLCLLAVAGLATFLVVLAPSNGGHVAKNSSWVVAGIAIVATAVVLVLASRTGPPWWRALTLGAAASVGFALTAALTKAFSEAFAVSVGHAFGIWQTYALCVVGLCSFLLMQHAFHAGPFAASQSSLILINPFVSVGLGAWLYRESFPHGAGSIALGLLGVVAFAIGAAGLCASPLIAGVHSSDEVQLLHGRGYVARQRARTAAAD
jgi:drug/metabolite transporter (DMT)-like permease